MNTAAIEIIRHSLNAASAALALVDTARPEEKSVVVEPAIAPVFEQVAENTPVPNPDDEMFERLYEELDGSEYSLRTISELTAKLGMSHSTMMSLLNNNDVEYVTRQRRSDSAPLIGLASRN